MRYEITDLFKVTPSAGADRVRVWCPVITDTPYQRVLDLTVTTDPPGLSWELTRDAEFGNVMFHATITPATALTVSIGYAIERLSLTPPAGPSARPLTVRQVFLRSLHPERHVDLNATTQKLARQVTAGEDNPLTQARMIYDHVTGAMEYDARRQSFTGSTQHALVCSVGNCNDIHALLVSLCRSIGIPARFVLGQALEQPAGGPGEGQDACDVCGYHCWAEIYIAGLGWLPADASCATKYSKHGLFGALETNHIAFSTGRDFLLAPPQHGPRILFFAAPYAEADAQDCPIERHLSFTQPT